MHLDIPKGWRGNLRIAGLFRGTAYDSCRSNYLSRIFLAHANGIYSNTKPDCAGGGSSGFFGVSNFCNIFDMLIQLGSGEITLDLTDEQYDKLRKQ
jgi:hypothetical protein